jgi:cytidylate kinase
VLKVLLTGSRERRIARVASVQNLSADQARQAIEEWDRQRREYFHRAYHMEWLDAAAYDVMLNTDRLSQDLARDMIVACAREVP